mmetsp:Transcript_28035/g.61219  ORF Transcript_28035/g.61219 Transcript_28035/m.61219 type:complete len:203 (+) Transcript_28035:359-967(+)
MAVALGAPATVDAMGLMAVLDGVSGMNVAVTPSLWRVAVARASGMSEVIHVSLQIAASGEAVGTSAVGKVTRVMLRSGPDGASGMIAVLLQRQCEATHEKLQSATPGGACGTSAVVPQVQALRLSCQEGESRWIEPRACCLPVSRNARHQAGCQGTLRRRSWSGPQSTSQRLTSNGSWRRLKSRVTRCNWRAPSRKARSWWI